MLVIRVPQGFIIVMVALTHKGYFSQDVEPTNHRSLDRVFVLEFLPNAAKAKIDTRLLDGNNRLHAIKDKQLSIWSFKLDHGQLPEAFKSSYTSFNNARKHVEQYFIKRGVKVTEILD